MVCAKCVFIHATVWFVKILIAVDLHHVNVGEGTHRDKSIAVRRACVEALENLDGEKKEWNIRKLCTCSQKRKEAP